MVKVYLSDAPYDPIKVNTNSITKARADTRLYIKQWQLDAKIIRVEKCPEEK